MPIPTFENKNHFKQYLRYFKNKFTSQIQPIELSYLEAIISNRDTTIPSNTTVNMILFDNKETVDISASLTGNEYLYFPAVVGDQINIPIDGKIYNLGFHSTTLKYNNNHYGLNQSFLLGSKVFTVKGIGGGLVAVSNAPTYTMTQDVTSLDEGQTVTFTVTTTDVPDGTSLVYVISGSPNFNYEDLTSSTLSGSVAINNNTGTIQLTTSLDYTTTEGVEYFELKLKDASGIIRATSSNIFINDSSTATYAIGINSIYNENDTLVCIVSTTGIPDNTTLYWDVDTSTVDSYDFSGSLSGNISIVNNLASFQIGVNQDFNIESDETFEINFRVSGSTGSIVSKSSLVTITDTPFTITATPDKTTIVESTKTAASALNVTVVTTGAADGTLIYPSVSLVAGNFNGADVSHPSTVAINNNTATFAVDIIRDGKTEGPEIFKVNINNQVGNTLVTTPDITITDTSFIGSRMTGMTFGPVSVNRDQGVVQNTSDWYTICNLDQAPDDAKIAIFIDQSGSMTMNTIQASYDLLVEKLNLRGIEFIVTTNSNEDWITPFDTSLDD
jgi:hypothetical protein